MASMRGFLGAAMVDVDEDFAKSLVGMDGKRGVAVTMVPESSLAARTGLRNGDVILRIDGSDVINMAQMGVRLQFAQQLGAEKVLLTVLRAGKTQDITFTPPR